MIRIIIGFFCMAAAACETAPSSAASTSQPASDPDIIQVMVLGSYHMGNPGQDVVNVEADNVLTPKRQAELAAVVEALARFQPTMVAVERTTLAPGYVDENYAAFSEEKLATVADERTQIGYRLAALAGLERVYGVDEQPDESEPDYFPFAKLMEHAKATDQAKDIEAQIAEASGMTARFAELQGRMTIAELLIEVNTGELSSHDFYYGTFKYDRGEDQPGAELQAYWFMRNAKIFSKLVQIAKPGDRVVVVYGAGHKHWLEHFADNMPGFQRVDPAGYLACATPDKSSC